MIYSHRTEECNPSASKKDHLLVLVTDGVWRADLYNLIKTNNSMLGVVDSGPWSVVRSDHTKNIILLFLQFKISPMQRVDTCQCHI